MPEPGALRVALVLGTSAGGVGRHVAALAAGLTEAGHHVVVCGPAATADAFDFAATGACFEPVEVTDRPRPVGDLRAVRGLRGLLRDVDVVHAHGLRAGGLAVLALRSLGRSRPPLVVTLHNALLGHGAVAVAYGVLERVVARGAATVLGVSADLEDRMRALGARRVGHAVVPAPAGRPARRTPEEVRAGLGVDGPLVVTVARLAEQKGLPLLLDAAALLGRRSPRPVFVVAGDGPLEDALRTRIDAERLPVRLLGRRADVADLFTAADVAVCPSVWEGQPLVVQEALRAGAPLVATAVGGVPAMVGDAAVLVAYGDAAALAAAIGELLDHPAERERLSAAARVRARTFPDEAAAVAAAVEVYRALGATPR